MRAPDFWNDNRWQGGGWPGRLLAPLGWLYGATVTWKARHATPFDPGVPVICVGNLTAGGSGKTPIANAIATILLARGRKPWFLTRGYGGRERGPAIVAHAHDARRMGDEALLLAHTAPAIVARDRAAGARLAAERGADCIVMDDGHQNFALTKTLSLVVVDGRAGFGNGRMIPAGPLREDVEQGLKRADAVIVMGDETPYLKKYKGPVLRAHLVTDNTAFAGRRVFAFAGIGRPEKFIASLQDAGAKVMGHRFFPDHHPYQPSEIKTLKAMAGKNLLVTTQKDFVRLGGDDCEGIHTFDVRVRFDDEAALNRLLDALP
jgi:tetraacyldisaccharide 4'-kinase